MASQSYIRRESRLDPLNGTSSFDVGLDPKNFHHHKLNTSLPPPPATHSPSHSVFTYGCSDRTGRVPYPPSSGPPIKHVPNLQHPSLKPQFCKISEGDDGEQIERLRLLSEAEARVRTERTVQSVWLGRQTIAVHPNSIFWIKLLKSRFMLIQVKDGDLQLWDVGADAPSKPVCTYTYTGEGRFGMIDGSVVVNDRSDPNLVTLYVSTSSLALHGFQVYLSPRDKTRKPPELVHLMAFHGLSGILDAKDDLLALSHARGRYKAGFIQNSQTGVYVHLQRPSKMPLEPRGDSPQNTRIVNSRGDFCQVQHETVDIQIRSDIIVAARNTHLDLYLTTLVASVLQQPLTGSDIPAVLPFQSLAYPALSDSVYRGNLLRQPNPTLGIDPGDIALLSAEYAGCYGILAKPKGQAGAVSEAHGFEIQPLKDIASPKGAIFQAVIGQSGRRIAILTDLTLSVYFTSAPTAHHGEPDRPSKLAAWKIPGAFGDVPCGLDFDENSGICIVAMASGRIWVVDIAHMSVQHQDTTELHPLPLLGKYNGELPTPYPSQWHIAIPSANPFEVEVPSMPPLEVAPGWSDAVDEYFPYKNCPDFYGGTVWLLHEAFHLPVVQPGHGASSDEEYGARAVLFRTTELRPSGYRDGCLEVIEVRPLPGFEHFKGLCLLAVDYDEWYFYKLDPTYDLQGIVKYLQDGGNIDDLHQDTPVRSHLPPDDVKLNQYRLCRELYTQSFRPAGGTVLPW